jgi:RNA polymerase sigma-70 factor (ECF subfamily)
VLQDTFVEVIRGVSKFRDEAGLGTWIHRIAINKCLSQLRSPWWTSRVHVGGGDDRLAGHSGSDPETEIELERLLDRLPDVARAVVWLHDAEGFTHREIADLMGRTESFSKSQLQRAHRRLHAQLSGDAVEEIEAVCTPVLKTV